jgi:hypothetical protein
MMTKEETVQFIDCNSPGTVYVGTCRNMRGLDLEGGYSHAVAEEEYPSWPRVDAPEWWGSDHHEMQYMDEEELVQKWKCPRCGLDQTDEDCPHYDYDPCE